MVTFFELGTECWSVCLLHLMLTFKNSHRCYLTSPHLLLSSQVQMLFNNESLPDHMTMKRLWLSHWFGKVRYSYR